MTDHSYDETTHRAADMMEQMQAQVFAPHTITLGHCPNCHRFSQGAKTCADCLATDLSYIVGRRAAQAYLSALINLRDAQEVVMRIVTKGA